MEGVRVKGMRGEKEESKVGEQMVRLQANTGRDREQKAMRSKEAADIRCSQRTHIMPMGGLQTPRSC